MCDDKTFRLLSTRRRRLGIVAAITAILGYAAVLHMAAWAMAELFERFRDGGKDYPSDALRPAPSDGARTDPQNRAATLDGAGLDRAGWGENFDYYGNRASCVTAARCGD